ncbi:MAG: hypothetical protein H5T50_08085 [Nitrososphaeria archaeon]|nr:hypothetical protein [Nitrososphaeria archaeon]
MGEDSSKEIIGNVLKMFFEDYKKIYLFYTIMIILLTLTSIILFIDNSLVNVFELSIANPFGIILSLFVQNSLPGLAVNIFSTYLIIFAFTSSSALLKSYNLSLKNDFSKYFILSPILSSILSNLLTYLILTIYNLDYVNILGSHVLIQSLIGLTSTILFYMFLTLKGYKKIFYPILLTIVAAITLYIIYGIQVLGLGAFMFDFQKFSSLIFGLLSGAIFAKLKFD